jgi:general secretion pathway protein D
MIFSAHKKRTIAAAEIRQFSLLLLTVLLLAWKLPAHAQAGLIEPTEEISGLAANQQPSVTGVQPVTASSLEEPMLTINFRDADILEVLEAYSNLLDVNVVPGEGVSGMVTVISPGPVTRSQAVNLLHSILKHRGFSVIENDGFISVVQEAIAELSGFPLYTPGMPDEQVAVVTIRPRYIDEETLAETLGAMGLMRPVSTNRDAGVLVVTAAASKLRSILTLVEKMDLPQRVAVTRTYPLQYAAAPKLGPVIAAFVAQLTGQDAPPSAPEGEEGSVISGSVVIEERTNSLIITAEDKYHRAVVEMLIELDKRSPQILLEAKVVEITLDQNNRMGLQWQRLLNVFPMTALTFTGPSALAPSSTVIDSAKNVLTGSPEGINYALLDPKNYSMMVNLLAKDSDARVLASPHLMASNNIEANLRIGEEIPILKETRMDTNNQPIKTFDREKVGLELKLKPTIASNRDVSLDLEISNSNVIAGTSGDNQHTITERVVKTHVIIKDKHTLVISGLIRDDISGGSGGIPTLKDLPTVGSLFGSQHKQKKSTELLILITPYVILSEQEAVKVGTDQLLKHPGAATAGALDHIEMEFNL